MTSKQTVRIELNDGKYTYVREPDGKQYALRYGEEWRALTGDNLIYWMALRIEELEEAARVAAERGPMFHHWDTKTNTCSQCKIAYPAKNPFCAGKEVK